MLVIISENRSNIFLFVIVVARLTVIQEVPRSIRGYMLEIFLEVWA